MRSRKRKKRKLNFKRANENLFQKVKDQTVAVQVLKETVRTEMK